VPVVDDGEPVFPDANRHRDAVAGVFDRVVQEVLERSLERVRVGPDRRERRLEVV